MFYFKVCHFILRMLLNVSGQEVCLVTVLNSTGLSFSLYPGTFGASFPSTWHFICRAIATTQPDGIVSTLHYWPWPCLQQCYLRKAAKGSVQSGCPPLGHPPAYWTKLFKPLGCSLFCSPKPFVCFLLTPDIELLVCWTGRSLAKQWLCI